MEDFDSGWDELPSSLDSENLSNYDLAEAFHGFESPSTALQQQMLEMQNDPSMPTFQATIMSTCNNLIHENKTFNSMDCSSLSSEIFQATRLLHDDTLDSANLAEPSTSPFDHQTSNNYFESSIENESIDTMCLQQPESLNEFLYDSFDRINCERPSLNCEEDGSLNKATSWLPTAPEPFNKFTLPVARNSARKKTGGVNKKPKPERKKRIKKNLLVNQEKINNLTNTILNSNIIKEEIVNTPTLIEKQTLTIPTRNIFKNKTTPNTLITTNLTQTRDGRKIPAYLFLFRINDKQYSDIYSCKYCPGIYTTLDSAMFHQCIRKRRGRKPKILADCLVPL